MRTATTWNPGDLHEGMVIYCPPHQVVDPKTRTATGALQKFLVGASNAAGVVLTPYHGDQPALMPPSADVDGNRA